MKTTGSAINSDEDDQPRDELGQFAEIPGSSGTENDMINSDNLKEINNAVRSLIAEGVLNKNIGIADIPVPVTIGSVDDHAAGRMKERGITEQDAQSFIDNAMIMFNQRGNSRRLYVSHDGNSAVIVEGSVLITAYSADDFDDGMKKVISEVGKYG